MKTTENISIAGYSFTIEQDAFEALDTYLNDIKTCFRGDSSADEIVADIEERIAELLREKYISGMVIDIAMIEEVTQRIGKPEQLAQEDPDTASEPEDAKREHEQDRRYEKRNWTNKRLYRNMEERVFGGVCSGLGSYFGIDKVLFRIIFLIFFMIGVAGLDDGPFVLLSVAAYVCLWIAMPAARTGEQKREMKGKPTNLESYRNKDFNFGKEMNDVAKSPAGQAFKRAGCVFLGILLLLLGLGGLLCSIIIPAMPEVTETLINENILRSGDIGPEGEFVSALLGGTTFWGLLLIIIGIGCVGVIYGGIMLLFDLKSPAWRPGLVIFIAWIISIFILAAWTIKTMASFLPDIV